MKTHWKAAFEKLLAACQEAQLHSDNFNTLIRRHCNGRFLQVHEYTCSFLETPWKFYKNFQCRIPEFCMFYKEEPACMNAAWKTFSGDEQFLESLRFLLQSRKIYMEEKDPSFYLVEVSHVIYDVTGFRVFTDFN